MVMIVKKLLLFLLLKSGLARVYRVRKRQYLCFKIEVANPYIYSRPHRLQTNPTDTNINCPPDNNLSLNLESQLHHHAKLNNLPPHPKLTLPSDIICISLPRTKASSRTFPNPINPIEPIATLDSKLET